MADGLDVVAVRIEHEGRVVVGVVVRSQSRRAVVLAAGHERGGCCLSMTLRDYARFGLFMLEGGKAGGRRVVPQGWIEDATRAHVAKPPYGYFWWITPGGYEAEGIFGQTMSVFPKEHLVVVINSAWPAAWSEGINKVRLKYLAAIRAAAH